jgi:hypothetical protein
MCTAIEHDGCFGRTLDLDVCYPFHVTATPRQFPFAFAKNTHHAMIGMATVANGYPLYYEAVNEHGLGMAALRFARCAVYHPDTEGTVASFDLIPWVLSQCATVQEARERLRGVRISNRAFSLCRSLKSVYIGKNVTYIGSLVFEGCMELSSIDFGGTVAEWEAMEKSFDWYEQSGIVEVRCTDGTVDMPPFVVETPPMPAW